MLAQKLKVLVIDEQPLFLDGLKKALESLDDTEFVVHTSSSSINALKFIHQTSSFDLILCSLTMPELGGIEFIKKASLQNIWTPIAIISVSDNPDDITVSLNEGASGYINKSLDLTGFKDAILSIMSGVFYVPDSFHRLCKDVPEEKYRNELDRDSVAAKLGITLRQFDVLSGMAEGLSNREICTKMGVAESTIKSHGKVLFQILNVKNRTACILEAKRLNLIPEIQTGEVQTFYQVIIDVV